MSIYDLEAAFGASDKTGKAMRKAMENWFALYYETDPSDDSDPCQRIAYTVVNKLAKSVFGEYSVTAADPVVQEWLAAMDAKKQLAIQLALVGGSCFLKPCPNGTGFSFTLIPRNNVLVFARDDWGMPTDIGTVERSSAGRFFYTLLERRTLGPDGMLTIENKLLRSTNEQNAGTQVSLKSLPQYAALPEKFRFPVPLGGLGLVQMKTPILNCIDGSADGVSVFAPAVGLIQNLDRNEAQLCGEFQRGQSRIIVSRDMLDDQKSLTQNLFVGLDDDPDRVGITLFSPQLRQQSYLERKQEYLRNIESVIGLKRGMLCDANMDERTATEISASAAEYNLTVMDFQRMWQGALEQLVQLCAALAGLYGLRVPKNLQLSFDWGNGVLYDEEVTWQGYMQMVQAGLLKPEIALGWRFGMKTDSEADLAAVRQKYMP